MLRITLLPLVLLPVFFLVSSTFISESHGASQIHLQPTLHIQVPNMFLQGIIEEGEYNVLPWETRKRRRLVPAKNNPELSDNKTMILAAERTHRKDPFNKFKYYKGGWNITEEHYFYSVAYTAVPLFVIAVLWFLGYAVTLLIICIRHCFCKLKHQGDSHSVYVISLTFLVFFTIAEMIGCVVLYTGQEKFHGSSTSTLDYVVNQADNTIENLTIVSNYLSAAKGAEVDQVSLPSSAQTSISEVNTMINSSIATLRQKTYENSDKIRKVLHSVQVILIIVAAVMLLLALIGFLLSVFGLQTWVYTLSVVGWILATVALILCGLFLILHNVVGDTCVAMDEWVRNPTAHTALDDVFPCVDKQTAHQILSESRQVAFQLVVVVNTFITNVSNLDPPKNLTPNLPPDVKLLYYNQSGPLVPVSCNPLNSDMTDRECAAGDVDFSNASREWSNYICQVSDNGNCTTTGRLTPKFYNQITYAVNLSYALYHYGPFLGKLVDCSFVRQTFNGIIEHHCPGLNRYSEWIFIGFVMVSFAIMLSLIFWVFYARERRRRFYSKNNHFLVLSGQESAREEENSAQ